MSRGSHPDGKLDLPLQRSKKLENTCHPDTTIQKAYRSTGTSNSDREDIFPKHLKGRFLSNTGPDTLPKVDTKKYDNVILSLTPKYLAEKFRSLEGIAIRSDHKSNYEKTFRKLLGNLSTLINA